MGTVKVSICISVHNTEKYLRRCLDSVIAQTLAEKEIVLVDNGSTDSSLKIMQEYRENNPGLAWKIVSQEDRGLAQGRQTGLDNAEGEFVGFVDADDWVEAGMYAEMYEATAMHGVDIVECQVECEGDLLQSEYTGKQDAGLLFRRFLESRDLPTMLWMRIYRRELFATGALPRIYVNNEDIFAFPCLLYGARSVFFMKKPFYHYSVDNPGAVMQQIKNNDRFREKILDNRKKVLEAVDHVRNFVGGDVMDGRLRDEYEQFKFGMIFSFLSFSVGRGGVGRRIDQVCRRFGLSRGALKTGVLKVRTLSRKVRLLVEVIGLSPTLALIEIMGQAGKKGKKP